MKTPYPIITRYNYPKFNATTFPDGKRLYVTPEEDEVPSVTTILQIIPKPQLEAWRRRKGEEEANRISSEACRIGSMMHDRLEGYVSAYLQGRPDVPPESEEDKIAYQMAQNMRKFGLIDLDEVWGIEEALYCKNLYAGRTDLTGVYDRKSAVIDYKSAQHPKTPEVLEGYKLQIAAYNFCHRTMFGEGMQSGVILIAMRPSYKPTPLQRVVLDQSELSRYEDEWQEVVEKYYASAAPLRS